MSEFDRLLAGLIESKGNIDAMRILADWCEEHDMVFLTLGLRWAAKYRRWPHISPRGRIIRWRRAPKRSPAAFMRAFTAALPAVVYEHLPVPVRKDGLCGTVPLAFSALGQAIDFLATISSIEGDDPFKKEGK